MAKGAAAPRAAGTPGKKAQRKQPQGAPQQQSNDDVRRETPLQAIVFADSFSETFRPITLSRPKVLLPLANVPMLEYTLEFLASSGVQEVVVFCTRHVDEIERFLATESVVARRVHVRCVYSATTVTAGDALREIDRQQLIQSDPFVLVSGDVVANVALPAIIAEHRARHKADPNCIMTSVFKELPPGPRSTSLRALHDELVVAIDAQTSQLVLYEDAPHYASTRLATVFLEDHAQLAVRTDLLDCYIDVCSTEVLFKFSEDFDYQHLRQDFLHNEVQNYELGKKFFAKIVTDEFAARVLDPRTYSGISRAILQRWVFPLVPDNNYLGAPSQYTYHRGMVYRDADVSVSRTCALQRECIVGAGTRIGDGTVIRKSAVGRGCRIGKNVTIEGSFLWGNVVVEDGVVIKNAIVCDDVVIRAGAVVEEGCVLSFGVVIGAGFRLPAFTKVTTADKVDDDDGFSSEEEDHDEDADEQGGDEGLAKSAAAATEWNPLHVGVGGVGRLWTLDDDGIEADSEDEDEDDDGNDDEARAKKRDQRRLQTLKAHLIGGADVVAQQAAKWDAWETTSTDSEAEDEDDDGLLLHGDGADHILGEVESPTARFHRIVRDTVISGDVAGNNPDDLFMEIKGFKFSENRTFGEVIHAILSGLLDRVPTTENQSVMALAASVLAKFTKWSTVLQTCLKEDGNAPEVIAALEAYVLDAEHRDVWTPVFRYLLQSVHDLEWVSEDDVLEWHASRVAEGDENAEDADDEARSLRVALATSDAVQEFIDWLQEEEEESDEEESDEDDDDEEEEDEDSEDDE
ncbi:hypothetical protein P43SY_001786 [Pythium insidiosum]|uniref:Translation initiation factor eIF2B subunit epsilon n=1 Tax=Pythium insidiosum TaxID=114742 RepID=A0AAD5LYK0_PYTIN|nr:hypothetical protein P43SY_001786 [Pythium insidiosum]